MSVSLNMVDVNSYSDTFTDMYIPPEARQPLSILYSSSIITVI